MKLCKVVTLFLGFLFLVFQVTGFAQAGSSSISIPIKVTDDEDIDLYPEVSPDGKQVVFESTKNTINGYGRNFEIIIVDEKGQLSRMTTDSADENNPSWMNNNKGLVFDSNRNKKRGLWIKSLVAGGEIRFHPANTLDFDANCNLKENKIVFTAIDNKSKILMERDGMRWRKFRLESKMPYIWISSIDGLDAMKLVRGINPRWSPDGKKIVYASIINGDYEIFTINADGSEKKQLTFRHCTNIEPAWSPDGEYIAFTSLWERNWDIWMMKADGNNPRRITRDDKFDGGPSWGRDGYIFFHTDRAGHWDIWKVKPAGYEVAAWVEDQDEDGIKNEVDKCPEQPEDKDNFEDSDGCPDTDNDKDGIEDSADNCPNEPETKNEFKDNDGCPDEIPIPMKQVLHGLKFNQGSDKIPPEAHSILINLVNTLKKATSVRVEIRGYTESRGNKRSNIKISQKRADAVRAFLISNGLEPHRIVAKGYGPADPIASNYTKMGREQNRRIEVWRINQ